MANTNVQTTTIRKQRVAALRPRPPQPRRVECEETLVRDNRAELRPAELVERKLRGILKYALIPVSQIRLSECCGARNHR